MHDIFLFYIYVELRYLFLSNIRSIPELTSLVCSIITTMNGYKVVSESEVFPLNIGYRTEVKLSAEFWYNRGKVS